MLNNTLDKYRYIQYSSEVLSPNCTRKACLKKNAHTRAAFENILHVFIHSSCIYLKKYKVYKTSCPANSYNANLGRTRL